MKGLLAGLREAYPIGVPAMIAKSHTDRLGQAAGYAFHLGTPDDQLRRICSWLLTHCPPAALFDLIPALWDRHGREDVALAGLLLANVPGEDHWGRLAGCIDEREPAEALLLSIEECLRAGLRPPELEMLLGWCAEGGALGHLALLTHHAWWVRNARPDLPAELKAAFTALSYPDGDSLLARVRDQMV